MSSTYPSPYFMKTHFNVVGLLFIPRVEAMKVCGMSDTFRRRATTTSVIEIS